jgi:hypothetical protein
MNDWSNPKEEMQSGYYTLELAVYAIFRFGTEHRFLILSVWVLLLLEAVLVCNRMREYS